MSSKLQGGPPTVKLYYRIGEVADIVGVGPHVLRYWETEFRSIRPQKSRKGQRIYSRRDVDKLIRVKDLLHSQGFTIAGARKRLREGGQEPAPPGDPHERAASTYRQALSEVRQEVADLLLQLEQDAGARTGEPGDGGGASA